MSQSDTQQQNPADYGRVRRPWQGETPSQTPANVPAEKPVKPTKE